jgi:hypothetical protein
MLYALTRSWGSLREHHTWLHTDWTPWPRLSCLVLLNERSRASGLVKFVYRGDRRSYWLRDYIFILVFNLNQIPDSHVHRLPTRLDFVLGVLCHLQKITLLLLLVNFDALFLASRIFSGCDAGDTVKSPWCCRFIHFNLMKYNKITTRNSPSAATPMLWSEWLVSFCKIHCSWPAT